MMRQAAVVLLKKEITVNVFALCNTGKSTLLNAILGDRYSDIEVQSISTSIFFLQCHNMPCSVTVCDIKIFVVYLRVAVVGVAIKNLRVVYKNHHVRLGFHRNAWP